MRNFITPKQAERLMAEQAGLPVSRIPLGGIRIKETKGRRVILGVIDGGRR